MNAETSSERRKICHPGAESGDIKLDREFENLIPPLSPSELAELQRSLDEEGCRDALIVWKDHNTLVDGHNRIRYCREKRYSFPVIEREFANKDEIKAYIIHTQLGRRNLSPAAESYLRGKRYLETKSQGERTDLTSGRSDQKTAAERLGEEFQVGEKTIRRDAKFAETVDSIVENCGADVKNIVLSRDSGLTRGSVIRLAQLKQEDQKKYIQELKETGKRPRKPRKGKRRETMTLPAQPKALVQALFKRLGAKEIVEVSEALTEMIKRQSDENGKKKEETRSSKRKAKTEK